MMTTVPTKERKAGMVRSDRHHWTYDDLRRLPETLDRYEIIDGVLYMSPSPHVRRHQRTLSALNRLLDTWAFSHDLGEVRFSPADIVLAPDKVLQPDLFFIRQENLDMVDAYAACTPDLVVEVCLPATANYDRDMKSRCHLLLTLLLAALFVSGCASSDGQPNLTVDERVPDWAYDAVWYQIFPERFSNGDPTNDPTWHTLELGTRAPRHWQITPWTADWYLRADWEEHTGPDFYHDGSFDRRFGGDLQGVLNRIDYLDSLGVTALYFNPVFWGRSLHKYDGNTFHHIDPHFGPDPEGDYEIIAREDPLDPETWEWTAADRLFLDLLDQAKARGMRVIIDGVFNHTGRDFFAFADLAENQADSPFRDWYVVQAFRDPDDPAGEFEYDGWWGYEHLPEFALNDAGDNLADGPKEYIFHATRRWMDPNGDGDPSRGIDGWRLDVTEEVPIGFWREWNGHVRSINPDAYTVTEIWTDGAEFVRDGGFSATMNYHAFAHPVKDFLLDGSITASAFGRMLVDRKRNYEQPVTFVNQNLIDSHDTDRLASMIVNRGQTPYNSGVSPRDNPAYDVRKPNDRERQIQQLVALFQMTYLGAPMVYYGTEVGMWGAKDPDCRMGMVWPDKTYDAQERHPLGLPRRSDEVAFDEGLFAYYRDAIALRNDHAVLRRGDFEVFFTDDGRRTVAFARRTGDEVIVVGINRGDQLAAVSIDPTRLGLPADVELHTLLASNGSTDDVDITPVADRILVTLPGLTGAVLGAGR